MSMVCWFDVPLPQTSDSRFEFSGTVLRRDFSAVDRARSRRFHGIFFSDYFSEEFLWLSGNQSNFFRTDDE